METIAIARPLPLTVLPGSSSAGSGLANLLTPHPREAFVASAAGATTITVDLGAATPIDTLFLGFTNLPTGAAVTVTRDGGQALAATAAAASYRRAPLRHAVAMLDAPVAARVLTFAVTAATPLVAGIVAAGLSLRPAGFEPDWGRPISDASRVERLFDGAFGTARGGTAGGLTWTWPVLTDVERDQLYALALDVGVAGEVLVVEPGFAGAAGNEAIHWGKLAKLQPFERQPTLTETKWSLEVQDWT